MEILSTFSVSYGITSRNVVLLLEWSSL